MGSLETPEEALVFLDELRDSGVTNMFGAGPYLMREFDVSEETAHQWLQHWMTTFAARHGLPEEGWPK